MLEWATRKAPEASGGGLAAQPSVSTAGGPTGAAAPTSPINHKPDSRGIALALGGGVAKGWAHIGVLRALDEHKIPVRMIAGTSIGALVGGCYGAFVQPARDALLTRVAGRDIQRVVTLSIGVQFGVRHRVARPARPGRHRHGCLRIHPLRPRAHDDRRGH